MCNCICAHCPLMTQAHRFPGTHTHIYRYRQKDRKIDRQRQIDRQIDRWIDRYVYIYVSICIVFYIYRYIYRYAYMQLLVTRDTQRKRCVGQKLPRLPGIVNIFKHFHYPLIDVASRHIFRQTNCWFSDLLHALQVNQCCLAKSGDLGTGQGPSLYVEGKKNIVFKETGANMSMKMPFSKLPHPYQTFPWLSLPHRVLRTK